MRIVEFPYSGTGEPNWPAEGESAFNNAKSLGDKIVGEYTGADDTLTDYTGSRYAGRQYRTRIHTGEIITLLGDLTYAAVFRAAYPPGAASADDIALVFLERMKFPIDGDGKVDTTDQVVIDALDYFITVPAFQFNEDDKAVFLLGIEE